ncbi:unnamed protein product, partial [Coregonus sp. 'balchen']
MVGRLKKGRHSHEKVHQPCRETGCDPIHFLLKGETFTSLVYVFCISHNAISEIVIETCKELLSVLKTDYLKDVNSNRIRQWVNTTSSGKIVQLSHPLNSEAPKGTYYVVWIGENKIFHSFKVEQYVLPKFEIKLNRKDEISVGQEEYKVDVCAKYTYGQPVPGKAEMDQTVCASHVFNMSTFMNDSKKILRDNLIFNAKIEEEGTGKHNTVSRKTHHTFLCHWKALTCRHTQNNLTTDSHGIASFSLNTTGMPKDDFALTISHTLELGYAVYSVPYFQRGEHRLSLIQPTSPHSKTSSSLAIQKMEKPLACGEEGSITVQCTIVGETAPRGSVDVIYL